MTLEQANLCFGPDLDIAAFSCVGVGPLARAENQDNYLLIDQRGEARFLSGQAERGMRVPNWPAGHARIAVLDGMGGHGRGREAAEAVVAGLLEVPACASLPELSQRLDQLHLRLQREFAAGAQADKRPGTTLTLIELPATGPALLYHVGDSRLYQVKGERVLPLTVDHVPATVFAIDGLLGEHEWWQQVHGEHRPQIAQAFILGNAFEDPAGLSDPLYALDEARLPAFLRALPDRRALRLDSDSAYLLATDGFWSCGDPLGWVARWPQLLAAADDAAGKVAALFDTMRTEPPAYLHPDNLTAIVLLKRRIDETALPSA